MATGCVFLTDVSLLIDFVPIFGMNIVFGILRYQNIFNYLFSGRVSYPIPAHFENELIQLHDLIGDVCNDPHSSPTSFGERLITTDEVEATVNVPKIPRNIKITETKTGTARLIKK